MSLDTVDETDVHPASAGYPQWERMFPDELEAAFEAFPVVYLPYGLCEPHGPQCAVGLDALKAHGLCILAAREAGGIVAPPDYWHIHELGGYAVWAARRIGERRPWLTAVPPWVHFYNLCYHIRAVDALGFHAAILVTGHYGPNWEDLKTVIEILQPHFVMRLFGLPDFEANTAGYYPDEDGASDTSDHAGKVETSQLWSLEPACVDLSRLPPATAAGQHFGMDASANEASRTIGDRMVAGQARWLGRKAQSLLEEYSSVYTGQRQPKSFLETEQLWRSVLRPAVASFKSMAKLFEDQESGPPDGSRWHLNWRVPGDSDSLS